MSSVFQQSNDFVVDIMSGRVPKGSIIYLQWPSGNSERVRFHRVSDSNNYRHRKFMVGCNMSWDNGATEYYDLDNAVVKEVIRPKPNDERWKL